MSKLQNCPSCGKNHCFCSSSKLNENKFTNRNVFNPTVNVKVEIDVEKHKNDRKKCECSARVNTQQETLTFLASICPNCTLHGSTVSVVEVGMAFNSSKVNKPQCISENQGTILNATGVGTLIIDQSISQASFTLNLLESLVGNDFLIFTANGGLDQNGNINIFAAVLQVPDKELMITLCNDCPTTSQKHVKPSKLDSISMDIKNGKIVMMKNGELEVKELEG
ncbi:hypothetical protein V7149_23580 [Bacillus sp. JJ1503]|uniref:hypothetical protein n=1 Tax=Bacillus sp. JJ1503 TaxID=3122956 RepID=UPI003000588D